MWEIARNTFNKRFAKFIFCELQNLQITKKGWKKWDINKMKVSCIYILRRFKFTELVLLPNLIYTIQSFFYHFLYRKWQADSKLHPDNKMQRKEKKSLDLQGPWTSEIMLEKEHKQDS